jgi:hypothetical protein
MAKERHSGYLEPKNEELFKAQSEKGAWGGVVVKALRY